MLHSRSMRAETRNRVKEEWKRAVHSIERVRKWEKKWVVVKDTTMKIFKWVPISERDAAVIRTKQASKVFEDGENDENSNTATKLTEDTENSQEQFRADASNENESLSIRGPTDFAALNEDSNTGFSEGGFDSDSNQAFSSRPFIPPSGDESTDFSSLAAEQSNSFLQNEEDSLLSNENTNDEPPSKRLKNI